VGVSVSVVVASRGRPEDLDRCITALCQLRYRPYEVVVVADDAGRAAIGHHSQRPFIRVIENDADGVAAARNLGIGTASGEIVAFIDDDAVPEPTWLDHLARAFEDRDVGAATGYVRGRNGISFQWRGRTIGPDGHHGRLDMRSSRQATRGAGDVAVMLEGTNMALRRSLMERIGGFDSAFRFFLDDADMSLRVSVSGCRTAVVPLAEVHHGFSASTRRRADRMPTNLFDNGRSLALFVRKHSPARQAREVLAEHRAGERRRLLRCMVDGRCEPREVARLLDGFDSGVAEGLAAHHEPATLGKAPSEKGFFRQDAPPDGSVVLWGRPWLRDDLRRTATGMSRQKQVVSVFRFSPTTLYHHVRFDPLGYWEHTGGVFGRSERDQPLFRLVSFRSRLLEEAERVAQCRGIQESVICRR